MSISKWKLDPAHSEIQFKVKHLMVTNVTGRFTDFDASIETNNDTFEGAAISFKAKTESIDTGNGDRDKHLRSNDFFDSENYPELKFESSGFTKNNESEYELAGNLTIRDKTSPVKLKVEYGGQATDPWGNVKAGFTISGKINRKDWNLNWNTALETGGWLVSDEVKLNLEIQLTKEEN